MPETIDFTGNEHIGVFTRAFEDIAVVPTEAPEDYIRNVGEALGVDVVCTTVQGSSIIGSLLVGNSNGMIVSSLASSEEIAVLEEYRDVMRLGQPMNAAGNVILANDKFAVLHPKMPDNIAERIGDFLNVPVVRMAIGGYPTVGMAAVATNNGILVNPSTSIDEINYLEENSGLSVGTGSVNMGSALVGSGLVANSKGYLAGTATSGYELGRIEEVFGF